MLVTKKNSVYLYGWDAMYCNQAVSHNHTASTVHINRLTTN